MKNSLQTESTFLRFFQGNLIQEHKKIVHKV
jgi:hypothetical protein